MKEKDKKSKTQTYGDFIEDFANDIKILGEKLENLELRVGDMDEKLDHVCDHTSDHCIRIDGLDKKVKHLRIVHLVELAL